VLITAKAVKTKQPTWRWIALF